MSDSCKPRNVEAGRQATYSISSVLMTSTMKSEPERFSVSGCASGSGAWGCGVGGTPGWAEGWASALVAAASAMAGTEAIALLRNCRRFNLSSSDMVVSRRLDGDSAIRWAKSKADDWAKFRDEPKSPRDLL